MSTYIGARSRAHASRIAAAGLTVFLAVGTSGAVYAAGGAPAGGDNNSGNAGGQAEGSPGNGAQLVTLCHVAGGTSRTIQVPMEAVGSVPGAGDHLAQHPGDHLGECGPNDPPPPGGDPGDGDPTTPPGDGDPTTPPGDGDPTTPPGGDNGGGTGDNGGGDHKSGDHKPGDHKPGNDDGEVLGTDQERSTGHKGGKGDVEILGEEATRQVKRTKVKVLPQTGTAETLGLETAAGLVMLIAGGMTLLGRRRESDI